MMNYENIKKIFKIAGDIASGIGLITGLAGIGFKINDAITEHSANKAKLVEAQADVLSEESSDISENNDNVETIEE